MKRKFVFILLAALIVLMNAIVSSINTTSVMAAGLKLNPWTVTVPVHTSGSQYFRWKITIPLAERNMWSPTSGAVPASHFSGGILHVEVGPTGLVPTATQDYPIPCTITGQIMLPASNGPVKFNGQSRLNCTIPSIREKAAALGYLNTIHLFEDFYEASVPGSTLNLDIKFQASSGIKGTVFNHQSMKITGFGPGPVATNNKFKAELYEDIGTMGTNRIYQTNFRQSTAITSGIPYMSFQLKPELFCFGLTSSCS